jgi:alpha-ketoglutaric semialdehyde dehydrogenase
MTITSRNPHDPADVIGEWQEASEAEVAAVVGRAAAAARGWAETPAPARAAALYAVAGALAERAAAVTGLVIREVGKPRSEAAGEVARGVAILRYFAQAALLPDGDTLPAASPGTLLMARRRPLGVTGLVTPWNFPVAIPLWKAAPSLAFGNATVLKPSEESSATALMLAEILAPHLPPDVFQVVLGAGETGRALTGHPGVAAVSFTGSVPAGHDVVARAAGRGARVQAEMGGQNASVVLADADFERAATAIAYAAMGYAGQKCTATSRAIVVGDPRPFTDALVAAVEGLAVGDPAEPATVVGPVINEPARRAVVEAAEEARAGGGRVLAGGRAGDGAGWFVAPTLVDRVPPGARVAQQEVFGPIAALLPAADDDQAVALANGVRYGLVSAVFTRDLDRALRMAARLDAGMIRVNAPTSGVDFHAPFGGEKDSSFGPREQGKAAREFYTSSRTITVLPEGG